MELIRIKWMSMTNNVWMGKKPFGNRFSPKMFKKPGVAEFRQKQIESFKTFGDEIKRSKIFPQIHLMITNLSDVINIGRQVHTNILYIYKNESDSVECKLFTYEL